MKIKKLLAGILSVTMLASATAALAAAPSAYDGQAYGSLGYTSDDPDGQFNLAVIANGDVRIYGDAMYIDGSVYSNGTIYAGNGQGNKVDGLFISGTENTTFASDENNDELTQYRTAEGFVHVNDDGTTDDINYYSTQIEHEGAILDKDTSFECSYEAFEIPTIANDLGDVEMNVYGNQWQNNEVKVITEDTHIGKLSMNGSQNKNDWQPQYGMTIDTTNGDVTVVIDELVNLANPSFHVVGDNQAYIYISNVSEVKDWSINWDTTVYDENWTWSPVIDGSTENTHLYLTGNDIVIGSTKIAVADMKVNANSLKIGGASVLNTNIESNVEVFAIAEGQTEVYGIVCVPNADSEVVNSGTLYGQLHTDTLTINGAGRIIWKSDAAVAKGENEPTPEPVDPTPAPVEPTPDVPDGDEIDLNGLGYAYIFGYEPETVTFDQVDEEGNTVTVEYTPIYMAPDDSVTREQVAAMLMRMVDQTTAAKDAKYTITPNIAAWEGQWFARGLAYLAGKGTFDGIEYVGMGPVTRGEVAKLVAYGLNLSNTTETAFTDIEGNEYEQYIEIMNAYGYMNGTSDTEFEPNRVMTRAEFCSMFNNIIGRTNMGLTTADGKTVTAEDYSIVDINGHWAYETMLKATSAYDDEGNVDFEIRQDNIRNKLDNYDSQLKY